MRNLLKHLFERGLAGHPRSAGQKRGPHSRGNKRRWHRSCRIEPLETRTILSGDFGYALGFGGSSPDAGNAIANDDVGNVYVTGSFRGTVDFDPGPGTSNLTSAGGQDAFVAKYSPTGALVWARRMGGSGSVAGNGIAVGADGQVYTTGYFQNTADFDPDPGSTSYLTSVGVGDMFVSKLDSGGDFVWARRMGQSGFDMAHDVGVAPDGSVYVAGGSWDNPDPGPDPRAPEALPQCDVLVTKLNSSGNHVWTRRMGGSGDEAAHAVAVGADGTVYLTGRFEGTADFNPGSGTSNLASAGGSDVFVCKLSAAGDLSWARRMGGGGNDSGESIALAGDGSVYTAGSFVGTADFDPGSGTSALASAGSTDVFVSKLSEAGNFVWARRMGGPEADSAKGIALGSDGDVFTVGSFCGTADFDPNPGTFSLTSEDRTDVFVSQLGSGGTFLAACRIGGPGSDLAKDVALGPDDSIYTTGAFYDSADFDPGEETFELASAGDCDVFISKLTQPAGVGNRVWNDADGDGVQDFAEPGVEGAVVEIFSSTDAVVGNGDDVSRGVTITDRSGFYHFTDLDPGTNYYLVFRTPVGDPPYAFTTRDAGESDWRDSDADANGFTPMFTLSAGEDNPRMDAGLVGTAPDFGYALQAGSEAWDHGRAVATDEAGNAYVAGYFQGTVDFDPGPGTVQLTSAGNSDVFVAKYSSTGALVWVRRMGGSSSAQAHAIAVGPEGSVYTTGQFWGTADFNPGPGTAYLTSAGNSDVFVSKLDSAGHFVWARRMGGSSLDEAYGIAVGRDGSVHTAGLFWGTADFNPGSAPAYLTSAGNCDAFASKLDSAGHFAWARRMGGSGWDQAYAVAVGLDGSVYTTGSFEGTVDFDPGPGTSHLTSAGGSDVFVSKLDSAGQHVWARRMGGIQNDSARDVALGRDGSVYTTGEFRSAADFDPGPSTLTLYSAGKTDAFVSKLSSAGDYVWAGRMGGPGFDGGRGIDVADDGSVFTGGVFKETADFDPQAPTFELTSDDDYDVFVSQLDGQGTFVWARGLGGPGDDYAYDLAAAPDGSVYTTGYFCDTADFDPGAETFQLASAGGADAFLSKLAPPSVGEPENYAVLFSGGGGQGGNHVRYYDNLRRLYETLVDDYDLDPANIHVLHADGTDPAVDRSDGQNSDMSFAQNVLSATPANLQTTLTTLAGTIDANDHFFFWSFDHGSGNHLEPAFPGYHPNAANIVGEEILNGWGQNINDHDLANWLGQIQAGHSTYVFTQCFAGGMLDDLVPLGQNVFGCAATNHYEFSWGDDFAAAFTDALEQGIDTTYAAYLDAHNHDASAVAFGTYPANGGAYSWGTEHPWAATQDDFAIFYRPDNSVPIFELVNPIHHLAVADHLAIPYDKLVAAAQVHDWDGDLIHFQIESVLSGTLVKDGEPVVPGVTKLGYGESLVWHQPEGAEGTLNAFTVRAFDGKALSGRAVPVPILIGPSQGQPSAADDRVTMAEDSQKVPIDVLANDEGVGKLQVVGVGKSKHGRVALADGKVVYMPARNWYGQDSFSYCMSDGTGHTGMATVTVTVTSVNDPPEAVDDLAVVLLGSEDNLIDVLDNDYDADADRLSTVLVSGPSHGTLSQNPDGSFSYTPDPGYHGTDGFRYKASDGQAESNVATVTIGVAKRLGPVDFLELKPLGPLTGVAWYQLETVHQGLLTIENVAQDTNLASITLYDQAQHQLAASTPAGKHQRVDWQTDAGRTYLVKLSGKQSAVDLRLANLVSHHDTQVTVHGTGGDDQFEFRAQEPRRITINGVTYDFDAARSASVTFDGGPGDDRAILHGSKADETVRLSPGHGRLSAEGYQVTVTHVESVTAHAGGGTDVAMLYGSAAPDTLVATPDYGRLDGKTFSNQAVGFRYLHAYGSTNDVAKLYDDPQGDDTFLVAPGYSVLSGDTFYNRAVGFRYNHAYSRGGTDVAKLYDDPNADDTFVVTPGFSTLSSDTFYNRAVGFRYNHAYSRGGNDVAKLYDDPQSDETFVVAPGYSVLSGEAFSNRAVGFRYNHAYSRGGIDAAKMYDDPDRDDTFLTTPGFSTLSNELFYNRAVGFAYTHAYASGGEDVAKLYDDPQKDDLFVATPQYAMFSNGEHSNRAVGFPYVSAYSTGGNDSARLYDDPSANDTFVATPGYGVLFGDGFANRAVSFRYVNAYSKGGSDVARLYDSQGNDFFVAKPDYGVLYGSDFSNRAVAFDQGYALAAKRDDYDSAYLYKGAPWQAVGDWEHEWLEGITPMKTAADSSWMGALLSAHDADDKEEAQAVDLVLAGEAIWELPLQ